VLSDTDAPAVEGGGRCSTTLAGLLTGAMAREVLEIGMVSLGGVDARPKLG
jgi:hypothetical protein